MTLFGLKSKVSVCKNERALILNKAHLSKMSIRTCLTQLNLEDRDLPLGLKPEVSTCVKKRSALLLDKAHVHLLSLRSCLIIGVKNEKNCLTQLNLEDREFPRL